jgi:hypothetical protein
VPHLILRAGNPCTAANDHESPYPSIRPTTFESAQNPPGPGSPGPTGPVWASGPHEFSMCPSSRPPDSTTYPSRHMQCAHDPDGLHTPSESRRMEKPWLLQMAIP